jgi:hypothetical protein
MDKKAQGLSMNVIIIAAISLLVLIILAVLVIRAARTTETGTNCEGVGGTCADACSDLGEGYFEHKAGVCPQGKVCCRVISTPPEQ